MSNNKPPLPGQLFMRHSHDLLRFLSRRVGIQDAPDLLQETYLRVLRHAERETIDDPGAFLHATAINSPRTICAAAIPSKNTWNSAIYDFQTASAGMVELFSPVHFNLLPDLKSARRGEEPPLGPDAVAAIVDRVMPNGKLTTLQLPGDADGVYVVGKRAPDEVNFADAQRRLVVDQYGGKIRYIQDRKNFTAGETFLEWQYPLHCGEAFGNTGRAFILLMGFVPLILYVTRFLRWRQKQRAPRGSGGMTLGPHDESKSRATIFREIRVLIPPSRFRNCGAASRPVFLSRAGFPSSS